ncbi:aspartic peptidase domain-containing protein [Mycena polygramma]|nr:aspartic peptidase domain-containing protein [Mycena polygramma]
MSITFPLDLALVIVLSLLAVSDARIAKRALSPPQTLVIPVNLDENQVYSVRVNMTSNPSPQSFSFALTTSTAISTVAGANCSSCGGVPSYNPSSSTSVQQLPQSQNVSSLNGAASGTLVRENCGLLQSNGSAWSYPNQTIAVADQAASFFPPGISGMLGMASGAGSPAANWLARNPAQSAFVFGMALNPPSPSNTSGEGGVLHWLQPDASAFQGDVTWKTMLAANASNPSNMSSWFVEMDAWSVSGGPSSFNISQSGTQLLTFVDPAYASIVFPQSSARTIYADIPGASKHSTSAFAHAWKLPCDSKFRLTVTFGNMSTSLDQTSLVVKQADGVCVGVLQEWIDASSTEYLLGSPFIGALYLIFQYPQSGDSTMGIAARVPATPKLAPAAIAGVVLGTVAVVALIIIAAVLLYSAWQRRSPHPRQRKYSKTDVTPFPSETSESTHSRNSRQRFSGQQLYNQYTNQYAGLLETSASTPGSPDWRTTLISDSSHRHSNTFAGGTTYDSHASMGYYRTTEATSNDVLLHLGDSPPPYPVQNGPPPVPLIPLRKTRRS